ncbi:MAG TPA: chemotaxis protein MotC [Mesorhizobium sp.]|jgi:chemotaxis protein MotC|nr:chemotaxis protein MotC [Mesorhizobium sp.]
MRFKAFALALGLAGSALAPPPGAAEGLQPSQLVRSLQLVQDRIAGGDHAALAMQRKLLELADERLRESDGALLAEPKEWEAALIYAMSGGNPATIEALMPDLVAGEGREDLTLGVFNNLRGAQAPAREALKTVDPLAFSPELGAYLSLVKGSLLAGLDAQAALALLDQARVLAPGTLVEEAALRRSVALAAEVGDRERFLRASAQYARRFLFSPYASQFADDFVSGVVALREGLDLQEVADATLPMDAERREVIFLRIARRAGVEHAVALAAFAAQQAKGGSGANKARAALYAALPAVASAEFPAALARLEGIDVSELTQDDRALLEAAKRVARGLGSEPGPPPPAPAGGETAAAGSEPREDEPQPASATPEQNPEGDADIEDERLLAAREALKAVDALLGETE